MAWNVQGAFPPQGSKERVRDQIEFIRNEADSPDVVMLNEVSAALRSYWFDMLTDELDYEKTADTLDWAQELRDSKIPPHQDIGHSNGNLIAVHERVDAHSLRRLRPSIREGPWEGSDAKDWSTNFPEKILNAELDLGDATIGLWNIRTVPGSSWGEEKIKIFEAVNQRLRKAPHDDLILAGDFNSPRMELDDGVVIPWGFEKDERLRGRWISAELDILRGLENEGMVDAFRNRHGYGKLQTEDVSFQSKRFDHIFTSESLNPDACFYDHGGLESSDHAPIIAELDV